MARGASLPSAMCSSTARCSAGSLPMVRERKRVRAVSRHSRPGDGVGADGAGLRAPGGAVQSLPLGVRCPISGVTLRFLNGLFGAGVVMTGSVWLADPRSPVRIRPEQPWSSTVIQRWLRQVLLQDGCAARSVAGNGAVWCRRRRSSRSVPDSALSQLLLRADGLTPAAEAGGGS